MVDSFLAELPRWITAFSSTGVLGVVGMIWLRSRRLGIEERRDRRVEYGDLLDRLNADVEKIKRINVKLYDKLKACDARSLAMKLRVGELHFVLRSLMQEFVRVAPDSPVIAHARELMAVVYPAEEPDLADDGELDALVENLP